ncbi:hypothetical protein LCGC14_0532480 [marine sediment metagenome]|uniref:Uncharacterized protein n=1 Tax=marine sediment metagenome TaxID=412755 RepID=A0A0F9S010_9ZZZZ
MTKIVWKVVRRIGGKRFSAVINQEWGGVRYSSPGEITSAPESTKLLAFKTKETAVRFGTSLGDGFGCKYEVWKAKAKNVTNTRTLSTSGDGYPGFVAFWKGKRNGVWRGEAPDGTVSCSELTLIKKVN